MSVEAMPVPTQAQPITAAPATPRPRLDWVDAARGSVICFVVLLHIGLYQYIPMLAGSDSPALGFWVTVNNVLGAFRMPALLVISGWLASKAVASGLSNPKTRHRIAVNGWLFVLWTALYAVETAALGAEAAANAVPPSQFLAELVAPNSTLWFLVALVWYTLAMSLLHKIRPAYVIAGAAILGAVSNTLLSTDLGLWVKIPEFFLFFALGAYCRNAWEWLARNWIWSIPGGAVVVALGFHLQESATLPGILGYPLSVVLSGGLVSLLFGLAGAATRFVPRATRWLTSIGRHTLVVYVLHYPILLLMSHVASGPLYDLPRFFLATEAGRWVYPLVLAALIILFSAAFEWTLRKLGATWLFQLPKRPAAVDALLDRLRTRRRLVARRSLRPVPVDRAA